MLLFSSAFAFAALLGSALAHNINLKAHSRECFHEQLHKDDRMTVTFQIADREFGGSQVLVPEAPTLHGPRFEVAEHDVAGRDEAQQYVPTFPIPQIDTQAALVTVTPREGGSQRSRRRRRAGPVRESPGLHFDHVGAEIGEQPAG